MVTNRVDRMKSRLSSAFDKDENTNLDKLLRTIAEEMYTLDDVGATIVLSHQWYTSSGKSLDYMAEMFDVTRDAGSDNDLRQKVATVLWQHRSCGSFGDIKRVVSWMLGVSEDSVLIIEPEAGQFSLTIVEVWTKSFSIAGLYDAVQHAKAGGILFLQDATVFMLDAAVLQMGGTGYRDGYKANSYGWGHDYWGSQPWGGDESIKMGGRSEIVPLTS